MILLFFSCCSVFGDGVWGFHRWPESRGPHDVTGDLYLRYSKGKHRRPLQLSKRFQFCIAEMTSLNILAFASMSCSKSELISLFFQSQSWNEMHNKYQYYLLWLTKGKVSYYILVEIQMPFFKRLNGALALVQVAPDVNFTWAYFLSVSLWSCTPEESICLFLIVVLQEVSFNPVFVCLTVFSSVAGQQQLHPKLPNRGTESRGWKTQKWRWVRLVWTRYLEQLVCLCVHL